MRRARSGRPATSTSASWASSAGPLLVNVGGIDPVLSNIASSPIIEIDLRIRLVRPAVPARTLRPYDTYASTAALWALRPAERTPGRPPCSRYSKVGPAGTPDASVSRSPYPGSDVVWTYDPGTSSTCAPTARPPTS